ncbi:hypothetical protein HY498_02305 [Candidatus Woesearchaeota archaeon]|nr:hypothetical protein [Candidatus Woesearchaeota archaeon]
MEIELINPYSLKILMVCRPIDSINGIANRIKLSYGWTHKWVNELAKSGIFKLTRMNVYLNEDSYLYKKTLTYIKDILSKNISFYYEALSLFGIKYCFSKTDAVFVWTKGGYNISRYKGYYPVFIKLNKQDKELFKSYCKKLGLQINKKKSIFYKVEYSDNFRFEFCDGIPVDPLQETISFMKRNIYNFEPALEMIDEIYGTKTGIKYKEAVGNV